MTIIQALVLGVMQGATEFLPVSSSGHLVLVPWLLGWTESSLLFDTVVHLGTLLAVVIYFWNDILALFAGFFSSLRNKSLQKPYERLPWLIVVSAIPGVVAGYLLDDWFESLFSRPDAVSFFLLVTGCLLYFGERLGKQKRDMGQMTVRDAIVMGLGQAMAIAPGISRSGATISSGLFSGLERATAARFSFIMGIPLIAGAAAYQMLKVATAGVVVESWSVLLVGFAAAGICGYLAIHWLLSIVQKHSLTGFAYYCWAAGLFGIALWYLL